MSDTWYIEDHEERARVRAAALPELDAASDDLQRYFMHQVARIHRLTAEVCDLREALKRKKDPCMGSGGRLGRRSPLHRFVYDGTNWVEVAPNYPEDI